jgi:hypothetical protein
MDPAIQTALITALAAVSGSIVGGLASLATTFFTQRNQTQRDLLSRDVANREELYSKFIQESTNLYIDSLGKTLESAVSLIGMYSLVGRMRLIAGIRCCWLRKGSRKPLLSPIVIPREHLRTHTSSLANVTLIRSRSSARRAEKSERLRSSVYSGVALRTIRPP